MKQRHQSQGNREASNPRSSQHGSQVEAEHTPIDFVELTVPQAKEQMDLNNNLKRSQIQQIQQAKQAYKEKLAMNSMNITQEALALGKIPIEKIAEQIYSKKITTESKCSPRTREVLEVANAIKKCFL